MDVQPKDIIELKKKHPCGNAQFTVLRVGMDFKIKCNGCGHEIMAPRKTIDKSIKKLTRPLSDTERKDSNV